LLWIPAFGGNDETSFSQQTDPRRAEQIAGWFGSRHPIVVVEDASGAVVALASIAE
jgi:hypothetical protein